MGARSYDHEGERVALLFIKSLVEELICRRVVRAIIRVLGGDAMVGQVCEAIRHVGGIICGRGAAQHAVAIEIDVVRCVDEHPTSHVELATAHLQSQG